MGKYKIHDFLRIKLSISQPYGARPDYYKQYGLQRGHEGVDFPTLNGTEFFAPFDGKVVREGIDIPGWKNYGDFTVVWDPEQRIAVWFCHLQDFTKQVGDTIKQGELLGHTNNTGNTSGPHVHVNFCETDENGVRLHQDDGMLGFKDIMDENLVEWLPLEPFQSGGWYDNPDTGRNQRWWVFPDTTAMFLPIGMNEPTPELLAAHSPAPDPLAQTSTEGHATTFTETNQEVNPPAPVEENKYTQSQYQEMERERDEAKQLLQDKSDELIGVNKNYSGFIALGYNTVNDVQTALDKKDQDNRGLQSQIVSLKKQLTDAGELFAQNHAEDATAIEMGMKAADELKDLKNDHEAVLVALGTDKPDLLHVLSHIDNFLRVVDAAVATLEKHNLIKPEDVQKFQEKGSGWLQTIATFLTVFMVTSGYALYFFFERGWK